jgi:hypothetical protein
MSRRRTLLLEKERKKERKEVGCGFLRMEKNRRK